MTQHTTTAAEVAVELVDVDVETGIIVQSLMFRHREQQRDLAAAIDTSPASLSRKLRGISGFSLAELMRIARHYGVEPGDLLPRLDSNQQPCGYLSSQVSAVDEVETWATMLDTYIGGPVLIDGRDDLDGDAGERWRAWFHSPGMLASRVLSYAELRRLVDVRPLCCPVCGWTGVKVVDGRVGAHTMRGTLHLCSGAHQLPGRL